MPCRCRWDSGDLARLTPAARDGGWRREEFPVAHRPSRPATSRDGLRRCWSNAGHLIPANQLRKVCAVGCRGGVPGRVPTLARDRRSRPVRPVGADLPADSPARARYGASRHAHAVRLAARHVMAAWPRLLRMRRSGNMSMHRSVTARLQVS